MPRVKGAAEKLPEQPAPKPLRISPELQAYARRRRPTVDAASMFVPAKPPPGVGPANSGLAMDEAVPGLSGWAGGWSGVGAFGGFLGYPMLAELAQRPEFRRVTETVASEMTREWIELKSSGDDDKSGKIKAINDALTRYAVQSAFRKAAEGDGFFGRGHLYIDTGATDRPEELLTSIGNGRDKVSFAKIKKGSLKAIRPVEAIWCYPQNYGTSDPLSGDWYKPEIWYVMAKRVHATRLLTFVGREVPDLLKPAYAFGGLSLSQMVKWYVDKFIKDAASVSDLVAAFSTMVLTTNVGTQLQMGGEELMRRIEFFVNMRDNRNLMVLDKSTEEELVNVSAPLGSLDKLQAQSQEHVCSASGLPLIKYTGLTPTGLNASSDGEIRSFYDWIKGCQEYLFRAPLTTVIDIVQLSEFGEVDPDITFDFVGLWQLDEAAKAAIQKTRADVHEIYSSSGVVSADEVRLAVAADPESPYAGLDLDAEAAPGIPEGEAPKDPADPLTEHIDRVAESEGGAVSGDAVAGDDRDAA